MPPESKAVSPAGPPAWLKMWSRALDTVCGDVGVVTGIGRPYEVGRTPTVAYLRPEKGGTEWQCAISDLRPAPPETES